MKKIVLTAVLTVALTALAAVLALPWWFGKETEKTYGAMLEQLSRGSGLVVTGRDYRRGWFASGAKTLIRLPNTEIEIAATHEISHGPLPLARIAQGEWRPAQAQITSRFRLGHAAELPEVTAVTTFHFDGAGKLHATMPAVKKSGAQGQLVDWRGLEADVSFDREWKKIRLDARLPSLTLSSPEQQGEFSVANVTLQSDMHEGTAGYLFGDAVLAVGRVDIGGPAGRVSLQSLEVSSSAKPAGEDVNLVVQYKLGEARAGGERYGPGLLAMELRRLDAAALMKFKGEMDGITRGNLPPPQAAMMLAGKGLELIGALARKAPELEITRLSFKTREGEITGRAKFVLDGRRADLARNPMMLVTALAGDAEISFPAPVVKQLLAPQIRRDIEAYREGGALSGDDLARLGPEKMAEIVDRVFPRYLARNEFTRHLVEDNGRYKLTLTLRRGQLLVNGQPWQFPTRGGVTL